MSIYSQYLEYIGDNEAPNIYHRWVMISLISTLLSRNTYFRHGPFTVYANQFIMLQGLPAVRKSSAIKIGAGLLKKAGYTKIAPDRTSREAFLIEMHKLSQPDADDMDLSELLEAEVSPVSEIAILAGEFLDFIGQNDKDYLMLLTTLWDNLDEYKTPKLHSKSVKVEKPTVNLLGGATPENLSMAFPMEIIGSGTLSRFVFIHSYGSGRKILMPTVPDPSKEAALVSHLSKVRDLKGEMTFTPEAIEVLEYIYQNQRPLEDPRFLHYSDRRLTHLLKLCMVNAASRLSLEMTDRDVLEANTFLGAAEYSMPKALGHFGRNRYAVNCHSLLEYMETLDRPSQLKELYGKFSADYSKESDFIATIQDLQNAGKIVPVWVDKEFKGVICQSQKFPEWLRPLMLVEELTNQEREVIGL